MNPGSLPMGNFRTPEVIRTPDLRFRKALLYPAELQGHHGLKKHGNINEQPRAQKGFTGKD
jgi:hypothetical protein